VDFLNLVQLVPLMDLSSGAPETVIGLFVNSSLESFEKGQKRTHSLSEFIGDSSLAATLRVNNDRIQKGEYGANWN
jgi:hypothetical protein